MRIRSGHKLKTTDCQCSDLLLYIIRKIALNRNSSMLLHYLSYPLLGVSIPELVDILLQINQDNLNPAALLSIEEKIIKSQSNWLYIHSTLHFLLVYFYNRDPVSIIK